MTAQNVPQDDLETRNVPLTDKTVPVEHHEDRGVPGFVRAVDDALLSRLRAHETSADLPSQWTPEHVTARLIEAFETLARQPGKVGPGDKSGHWPSILREFADLVDAQSTANKAAEFWAGRGDRVSSLEASRMDEALAWPMEHLKGQPLPADAITLYCWCEAVGREIEPLLRRRRARASSRAVRMAAEIENADQERVRARWGIAGEVAAWANERLKAGEDSAVVRKEAMARMRAVCAERGSLPPRIPLTTALPGVILHRKTLDRMRKRAAEAVAKALNKASVPVR